MGIESLCDTYEIKLKLHHGVHKFQGLIFKNEANRAKAIKKKEEELLEVMNNVFSKEDFSNKQEEEEVMNMCSITNTKAIMKLKAKFDKFVDEFALFAHLRDIEDDNVLILLNIFLQQNLRKLKIRDNE